MELLIGLLILFGIMYIMGYAFNKDLNDLKKTHPKYRKHLRDKYKL